MLLSTSVAKKHGVQSFQSGRSEASDVMHHSSLAAILKEDTCNCETAVHFWSSGSRLSHVADPACNHPPKLSSGCLDHSTPLQHMRGSLHPSIPVSGCSLAGEGGNRRGKT